MEDSDQRIAILFILYLLPKTTTIMVRIRNPRKNQTLTDYITELADEGNLLTEESLALIVESKFNRPRALARTWLNNMSWKGLLRKKKVILTDRTVDVFMKN